MNIVRTTSATTLAFKAIAALGSALLLVAMLASCAGQASQGTEEAGSDKVSIEGGVTPTPEQIESWKTLGDALSFQSNELHSASWNDERYVTVYEAGAATIRAVAKMEANTEDKIMALDPSVGNYEQQYNQIISGLELISARDLSGDKVPDVDLQSYAGRTGKDIMADGFEFRGFYMYGAEGTIATMDKGYLSYSVSFDAEVTEEQSEEMAAAIEDETITAVGYLGGSDMALDPSVD